MISIKPNAIFIIDAVGAILSITTLIIFQKLLGVSSFTKYVLVSLACILICFDVLSYFYARKQFKKVFLKVIAYSNIIYCCICLLLLLYFFRDISVLGKIYFLLEIFIIILLSKYELKLSKLL